MSAMTFALLLLAMVVGSAFAIAWAWWRTFDADGRAERAEAKAERRGAQVLALTQRHWTPRPRAIRAECRRVRSRR